MGGGDGVGFVEAGLRVADGVGIIDGFDIGVAWLGDVIGGGVGGGVAASAARKPDGDPKARAAAAIAPPAAARKKEDIFIGPGGFWSAASASFLTRLL